MEVLNVLICDGSDIPGDNPGQVSDFLATAFEEVSEEVCESPIYLILQRHMVFSKDIVYYIGKSISWDILYQL